MWIQRYESEQSQHIQTTNELLKVKADHQDLQMMSKNQDLAEIGHKRRIERFEEQTEQLQNVSSAQSQEIEKLKRDIQTKSEMLKVVEDQHCNYVRRLRDEYSKLEQKQEKMIFRKDIEYEDLMARTIQFKDTIVDLQKNVKSLEDAVLV